LFFFQSVQKKNPEDHLVWDKDDKVAMDFVAACANIRAFIFGIPQKSRFDIKCKLEPVFWVAVIRVKNHKRQRRKRQSVTAKREKLQTPKVLTAILTLPNLT